MLRFCIMEKSINHDVTTTHLKSGMSMLETIDSIKKGMIFLMESFFGDNVLTDGVSMYTLSDDEYKIIKENI